MEDMTEGMYGGTDIFEHGHIDITRFDNPDTGAGYDVDNGDWREPTDEEWAAIRKNENSWEG